jgi:hypothetical protein
MATQEFEPPLLLFERVTGIARDSRARRRSHEVWAPPHRIFLLENSAPAFDSLITNRPENTAEYSFLRVCRRREGAEA